MKYKLISGEMQNSLRNKIGNSVAIGWIRIANRIDKYARKLAELLNSGCAESSRKTVLIYLMIFCICFSVGGLYCFRKAFFDKDEDVQVIGLTPQKRLIPIPPSVSIALPPDDEILERIQSFKRYLDSLKRTKTGLLVYDSILRQRPGLIDSVYKFQELLNSK